MFLGLRKLGNICCGHKMFLNKIRNIFYVPDRKFVFTTNVACGQTGKHLCRQQCVRSNVSSFARTLKCLTFCLFPEYAHVASSTKLSTQATPFPNHRIFQNNYVITCQSNLPFCVDNGTRRNLTVVCHRHPTE